jgi:hypothetical protein
VRREGGLCGGPAYVVIPQAKKKRKKGKRGRPNQEILTYQFLQKKLRERVRN